MNQYIIRQAAPSDFQAAADLEKSVFGHGAYPLFFFRQAYDLCRSLFLVAELNDGSFAGHIIGGYAAGESDAWILAIAVDTKYRRQGIAKSLITELLIVLAEKCAKRVLLTVDPSNSAARRIYGNEGFSELEIIENYFGPGETRIMMMKKLDRE